MGSLVAFNLFSPVARAEWDTLLFFYRVVLCVGGLGFLGYLSMASELMYSGWGPTNASIAVGVLSAIVDSITVMFAVLTMGQARGKYTFFGHLKWTPAISAGYIAIIFAHMSVNASHF